MVFKNAETNSEPVGLRTRKLATIGRTRATEASERAGTPTPHARMDRGASLLSG